MLLKYFYDQALAHASYLVGCQRTGEAIVVDPGRHIEPYIEAARKEGLTIVGAAETHIHADYVSGMRELAARIGAKLYVSDSGPADWKYEYVHEYSHQLLKDGSKFGVGNIEFEVLETPGHTPESISFLLTDRGGGANEPMGIFTGDFVFVGSIGRPDLLEEAAGVIGSADVGARQLYQSIKRFMDLPDYLQLWPAHGAGSACGKGLGAIPSSTVGYEKRFNPAFRYQDEESFVRYILSEQPEAPKYFAVMKRVNKVGPQIVGADPQVSKHSVEALENFPTQTQLVDTRSADRFAAGHVPNSLLLPTSSVVAWGGWLIDYDQPVYLIANPQQVAEIGIRMRSIGIDTVAGYIDAEDVARAGLNTERFSTATPSELADKITSGELKLLDVRGEGEWQEGHIEQADHRFLGKLPQNLDGVDAGRPVVVQCRSGARSAIAASVLQRAGIKHVINLTGGIVAWRNAGLPTIGQDCSSGVCQTV
jgi:hydroxyacylglutathione hydrolase